MNVEQIVVRLFADATPYHAAMRGAELSLLSFAGVAGRVGNLLNVPIQMATVSTLALAAASGAAAYSAVSLAANYEDVAIALEVMTGSAEKGKRLLDDITKMAIETPFKSSGLQNSAKELSAFGVSVDQIIPTLKVLGDVASGVDTGNLEEMMSRVILAFGQVKTAGRLMGPEARQFVQAGVPIYEYLGKVMGKPVEMMKMMTEEGHVGFTDVVKAFNMMTAEGGRFYDMMDRRSTTTRGRWNALVETMELSLRDIGLAVFEEFNVKGGLEDLRKTLDGLRAGGVQDVIKDVREFFVTVMRVGKLVAFWIEKAYRGTRDWVKENEEVLTRILKIAAIAATILITIKLIIMACSAVVALWALIVSPIGIALIAVTAIAVALHEIGAMEGFGENLAKGFEEFLTQVKGLGGALKDALVAEDWNLAGKIIGKGLEIGLMTAIYSIGAELVGVFMRAATLFGNALHFNLKRIGAYFQKLIDMVDPDIGPDAAQKKFDEAVKGFKAVQNETNEKEFKEVLQVQAELMKGLEKYTKEVTDLQKLAKDARFKKEDPTGFGIEQMWKDNQNLWNFFSKEYADRINYEARSVFGANFDFANPKTIPKDKGADEWINNYAAGAFEKFLDKVYTQYGTPGLEKLKENKMGFKFDEKLLPYKMADAGLAVVQAMGGGPAGAKKAVKMDAPVSQRTEVLELAKDIRREMGKEQDKGIGFGAGQYTAFRRTMEDLQEGFKGPLYNKNFAGLDILPFGMGEAMRKTIPGVLTKEQFQFGTYREFQNLRRWIGSAADRMAPVAMEGSVEAQDIINRNNMQQTDKMQEMIEVLKAAQVIEEQQRDIMSREGAILEEILRKMDGRGFAP